MTIPLIFFILALVTIIALVSYQLGRVRSGQVVLESIDTEAENPLSKQNIAIYRNTLGIWLEARSRKLVLWILRISIKAGYFIKNKLDIIVSKVHRTAARHERKLLQEEEKPGTFLKTISEYRNKIRDSKEEE